MSLGRKLDKNQADLAYLSYLINPETPESPTLVMSHMHTQPHYSSKHNIYIVT